MFGVVLCSFVAVMRRMQTMRVGNVRVMSGLFVIAAFVMLGCFAMVVGGILVVLGCGVVVFAAFVGLRAHVDLPGCV